LQKKLGPPGGVIGRLVRERKCGASTTTKQEPVVPAVSLFPLYNEKGWGKRPQTA